MVLSVQQEKQRSTFFSIFYLSINAGSLLSTIITPILRGRTQDLEHHLDLVKDLDQNLIHDLGQVLQRDQDPHIDLHLDQNLDYDLDQDLQ